MKRWLILLLVVAVSVGWIIPLYAAYRLLLDWCRLEVTPAILGDATKANTFPFLEASEQMMAIALVWLGFVAAGWSFVAARRWLWGAKAQ
jgi:hypothetical protein